ncbi:MAG: response regulator [Desulfobacterota bacterium]|nr:response regulator [Thermodesulfobacteriota bacterium]
MKSNMILIAYQDDLGLRSLTTFFHGLGYRIETARTISEMIPKVRKGKSDVLLLDDELEGVKAFDLVPLLKHIRPRLQVIVVSSETSLEKVKRLREAGIFYHATKPIDLEEVRSAVGCAFEKIEREGLKARGIPFWVPGRVPA